MKTVEVVLQDKDFPMSVERIYHRMLWSRVKNVNKGNHFPGVVTPPCVHLVLPAQRIRSCTETVPLQGISSVQTGATARIGIVFHFSFLDSLQVPENWNCCLDHSGSRLLAVCFSLEVCVLVTHSEKLGRGGLQPGKINSFSFKPFL